MKIKILLLMLFILSFSITSCSNNRDVSFSSFGDYTYYECVFVNSLSSSTIEYLTELNGGNINVAIYEEYFSIDSSDSQMIHIDNPNYVNYKVNSDIDTAFNLNIDSFLKDISFRYDIYINEEYQGYSIFLNNTDLYIARIENSDDVDCIIWEIYILQ